MTKLTPFLMFQGQAEEAIQFYASIFKDLEIVSMVKYGPEAPEIEGKIANAVVKLHGQEFYFNDSNIKHEFTFTPSISMFLDFDTEQELDEAFTRFAENGLVLMPLASYGFSKKFGWVQDTFGVSWQLNLH
ncbi:VOC family protein [Ureibacillus chungkukjangi]|uniref:VOC family protein n=1 Tax=Ureibacillus chungkukjangi TaxID=1202712 RepID=UPI00203F8612|nr:VOC family protein [Ureibacillus chungkukjangi]MCM3388031.1 VOC family protein [Ureibacillus chungkukjangi]